MHIHVTEELKKSSKSDSDVERALKTAFDKIESEWLQMASSSFKAGFPQPAYVSTTALVSMISGNKVYVANAGDSRACVIKVKDDESVDMTTLNQIHDANNRVEQKRMKKEFPKDQDIYVCEPS